MALLDYTDHIKFLCAERLPEHIDDDALARLIRIIDVVAICDTRKKKPYSFLWGEQLLESQMRAGGPVKTPTAFTVGTDAEIDRLRRIIRQVKVAANN